MEPAGGIERNAGRRVQIPSPDSFHSPFTQKFAVRIEYLDPVMTRIRHVNVAVGTYGQSIRVEQLVGWCRLAPGRCGTPSQDEFPFVSKFLNPHSVEFNDIDASLAVLVDGNWGSELSPTLSLAPPSKQEFCLRVKDLDLIGVVVCDV